ncbi:MAG: S8 family serine peptidase, partial [Longimicrobiales bacterium]
IRQCMDAGVIVVAAMGERSNQPIFPAANAGVIAVGAVNPHDRPIKGSNAGPHAFIAAPGEGIRVVQDANSYERKDGTSYATAFVSAAVWLALRNSMLLDQEMMRELLKFSVQPFRRPEDAARVGFGILDLELLAANVGV